MTGGQVAVRVLSVVVAVGLIAGGMAIRGRDDDGGTAGPDDVSVEAGVVWCARELRICGDLEDVLGDEFEVEVDDGVAQFRALTQTDEAPTAWVTLSPLVDMTAQLRDREGRPVLLQAGPPTASTPLVLVGVGERLAALEADCGGTLDWSCIGEAAGDSWSDHGGEPGWGRVRPAHEALDESGIALLVTAQAVANHAETEQLSTRVYDDVALWFQELEQAVPSFNPIADSQLQQMIQQRGTNDVVGTTAAEAATLLATSRGANAGLRVVRGTPPVSAQAVVASPNGRGAPSAVIEAASELLGEAGWEAGGAAPTVTLPTPIESSTEDLVFDGGALEALLDRWNQVR